MVAGAASGASFGGPTNYEALTYDPTPDPGAVVACGDARFTVLTPALIRIQMFNSSASASPDAATLAFVNRKLPVPKFTVQQAGAAGCNITTDAVQLVYRGGAFSSGSLTVDSLNTSSAFKHWDGGMRSSTDPGSLLGTFRTLDGTSNVTLNCTVNNKEHCVWGVLSRSGWALVDDSDNAVLESEHDWPFDSDGNLFPRNDTTDWYLFAHGRDYRRALLDFVSVAGKPALLPRAALGVWFTRWFDYANTDIRDVVTEGYQGHGLPLSVLTLDMNFHKKNDWTGYTFDPNLFPDPADLGSFAREQNGLMTLVNLHDADGVGGWEAQYDAYCKARGLTCTGATVGADFIHREAMVALEDVVWSALQSQFADHAWIDWQQGEHGGMMPGGKASPTIQLNKVRNTDPKRRAAATGDAASLKRGMQLGRFGGYGNHRYPVGFSGDVAGLSWQNLAYQPYFTMTSSNAAFGLWSHDIVGNPTDHEMYVRWITWGSLSPIMRSHERGMSAGGCYNPFPDFDDMTDRCATVQPWDTQPYYFRAIKKTLLRRTQLVPYLYTAARESFDSGIALMRPLYYDWPEEENAYNADSRGTFTNYMLGGDLLVSPVTSPGDNTTLATQQTWLPPGQWVELETHRLLSGGRVFTRKYSIDQAPIFARAGAVVPFRPLRVGDLMGTAGRPYAEIGFRLYPGAPSGGTRVYEDDGGTTAYLSGDLGWIHADYDWASDLSSLTVTVSSTGTFSQEPATRLVTLNVVNAPLPSKPVQWTAGGQAMPPIGFSRWGAAGAWSFDGQETSLVVQLSSVTAAQLHANVTVTIPFDPSTAKAVMAAFSDGAKGLQANAKLGKAALDRTRVNPGAHVPDPAYLSNVVSSGDAMASWPGSNPSGWVTLVTNLSSVASAALAEISGDMPPPPPPPGALVQLFDDQRNDHVLCGTGWCVDSNEQYNEIRIEGYQPDASAHGAIKLNDYWNANVNDNWASTAVSTPSGYSNADFPDGYVLESAQDGTTPLYCYYSSANEDHMAVATEAGIKQAQEGKYSLCSEFPGGIMGYVFTQPSEQQAMRMDAWKRGLGHISDQLRADFVTGLLQSAMTA